VTWGITLTVDEAGTAGPDPAEHRAAAEPRHRFLARALAVGGAVTVGGVTVAGLPGIASSRPSPAQDARVLNLLLLLEQVQAALYREADRSGALTGELASFARTVGKHEEAHVSFIRGVLGPHARPAPRVRFGAATRDPKAFVRAAIALEDIGVAAYNGQATNVTRKTLAAAATIVSVEARHAAWIRDIGGRLPAIAPTDPAIAAGQLTQRLRATGFVKP
jgi:hypothetical protein